MASGLGSGWPPIAWSENARGQPLLTLLRAVRVQGSGWTARGRHCWEGWRSTPRRGCCWLSAPRCWLCVPLL